MCDPAVSVIVRTLNVYGWFAAGWRRNGSRPGGSGRKFVRNERLPPEKLENASRV
jgi:hypothetical protein